MGECVCVCTYVQKWKNSINFPNMCIVTNTFFSFFTANFPAFKCSFTSHFFASFSTFVFVMLCVYDFFFTFSLSLYFSLFRFPLHIHSHIQNSNGFHFCLNCWNIDLEINIYRTQYEYARLKHMPTFRPNKTLFCHSYRAKTREKEKKMMKQKSEVKKEADPKNERTIRRHTEWNEDFKVCVYIYSC